MSPFQGWGNEGQQHGFAGHHNPNNQQSSDPESAGGGFGRRNASLGGPNVRGDPVLQENIRLYEKLTSIQNRKPSIGAPFGH